jgi:tRNA A-37 threonylcarbamoyl transferase component Bud32
VATCPTCKGDFEASFCPRDGSRLLSESGPILGDRYRLHRKIGEGAMGEVYEGEHVHLNRKVAVKLLQRRIAADPEAAARLQREAQSTTGLAHPNVVDTIDFGFSADGQVFLVMEWLEGENLEARLARGHLDISTALEIAAQACGGVAAAHARGVVHRDLKPANLFLTRDHHGNLLVKVLDFGIAKLALRETKLTATGVLIGTPNYMAPEQAEGNMVDARTDVYAMGVILYEMLTGTVPFEGETPLSVLHQHTSRMPILPSARATERGISDALDMLVMRCLAKQPEERFATMDELAGAISEVRSHAAPRQRLTATAPAVPTTAVLGVVEDDANALIATTVVRRRWILALGIGLIAAVGVAVALFPRSGRPTTLNDTGSSAVVRDGAEVVVMPGDAAVMVIAPVDAAVSEVTYQVFGHDFVGTLVVRPAIPIAGQRSELTVHLTTLAPQLREAAVAGRLSANIEVGYFTDHSLVEESRHVIDADARFSVSPRLAHAGKHHARIDLLVDGKGVDHAKVDLFDAP